jgi:RNA 2',3'-cyclic 3'-phosphodiesterase
MKLFIAIDLPLDLKNELFNVQKKVKEAKITWVSKKHLHLTLKFLGEISEEKLLVIKNRLSGIKFSSFMVTFGEIGFSPSSSNPTIFWVKLNPENKIIELQQKIDETLLDLISNEQKFVSHVTLGRVKMVRRKKDFAKSISQISFSKNSFLISSFSVFSSEQTGKGSIYEVVENVKMS